MTWPLVLLLVACLWLLAWAIVRLSDADDAEEAQRNLAQLLSELVHYRAG